MWERRDELEARTKKGRPKGMHNRTYQELLDELSGLRELLNGQRRSHIADEHSVEMRSVWKPASEVRDLWVRGYKIDRGQIVRDTD